MSGVSGWYVYGQGTVTPDGKQVVPDPGVVIYEFTGAMVASPSFAPADGPVPTGGVMVPWPEGMGEFGPAPGLGSELGAFMAKSVMQVGDPTLVNAKAVGGEPVDLGTGLFVLTTTDLTLGGLLPISLKRVYRQNDDRSRAFGIGATLPYDMFLVGDVNPYTYQELILADGGRVRFNRISSGTGYADAVYEHTASPTGFYKAKIVWNGVHGQ